MKLQTTFWSDTVHTFDKLLYINGRSKEIIYQADLNNNYQTYLFFKDVEKFVKSKTMRKTIDSDCWNNRDDFYQFAVILEGDVTHIKWFDLIISDNTVISHDIAFETTLIQKNDVDIPLGRFPMYYYRKYKNPKLPKYREFNIKARAYKYMGNQVKKLFTK